MEIRVEKDSNVYVVNLEGRLDSNAAVELEDALNKLMKETCDILVDMNQVNYVTSAGMRVLLKTEMEFRKNGSLKLRNVNDEIRNILKVVNLLFLLEDDEKNQEVEPEEEMNCYIQAHVISDDEKKSFPQRVKALLDSSELKAFEAVDDEDEMLALAVTNYVEASAWVVVEHFEIFSDRAELVLPNLIKHLLRYSEEKSAEKISWMIEQDSPIADYMEKKCGDFGLKNAGIVELCEEYTMEEIKNSPVYRQLDQLSQIMKNVKSLNDLGELEMFDLRLSSDVDVDDLDPVFCRFFVLEDLIVGGLNAVEIEESTVVMNYLAVKEMPGVEHALIFMMASFIATYCQIMEDDARLIIDLDNAKTMKGVEKVLGKSKTKTQYLSFEK